MQLQENMAVFGDTLIIKKFLDIFTMPHVHIIITVYTINSSGLLLSLIKKIMEYRPLSTEPAVFFFQIH